MSSKHEEPMPDIAAGARDLLTVAHALGDPGIPEKYRDKPFFRNRASLKQTIPADAWKDAGITLTDPRRVTDYYYENAEVLLTDLAGTGFDTDTVADALDDPDIPEKFGRMALSRDRYSLTKTIPSDAWKDAGITLTDPRPVTHYYFAGSQVLLIDLGGRFNDE